MDSPLSCSPKNASDTLFHYLVLVMLYGCYRRVVCRRPGKLVEEREMGNQQLRTQPYESNPYYVVTFPSANHQHLLIYHPMQVRKSVWLLAASQVVSYTSNGLSLY